MHSLKKTDTARLTFGWTMFVAVLMASRALIPYLISDGFSNQEFSDLDEPYYLPLLREVGSISTVAALSFQGWTFGLYQMVGEPLPHAMLDFLIGKLFLFTHLSLPLFGVILDFVCVTFSYIAAVTVFRQFEDSEGGEPYIAAFVLISLPWLASFNNYIPMPEIEHIRFVSHYLFPSQPVIRAVYTQVSFVSFLWGVNFLVKLLRSSKNSFNIVILLALVCGSLIYQYFFAWGALGCLVVTSLVIDLFLPSPVGMRLVRAKQILIFLIVQTVVASFGLLALFSKGEIYSPGASTTIANVSAIAYRSVWFIAPVPVFIFCGLIYYCYKKEFIQGRLRALYILAASISVSELILMNSQSVIGRWLTPYHFPLFFLHPLWSGLFCLLIFQTIQGEKRKMIKGFILMVATIIPLGQIYLAVKMTTNDGPTTELLREVSQRIPSGQSLALIPFDQPFARERENVGYLVLPYSLKTLSHAEILAQPMSFSGNRTALVERELSIGWLFSGNIKLIASCAQAPIDLRDILTGTSAFNNFIRQIDCQLAPQLAQHLTPCKILSSIHIDYILWDNAQVPQPPIWYSEVTQPVWASSDNRYKLLKFDQSKAVDIFCSNSTGNSSAL